MGTVFLFSFFFLKLLLPAHGSGEQRAVQEGSETPFAPQLAFTRKTLASAAVDGWQILRHFCLKVHPASCKSTSQTARMCRNPCTNPRSLRVRVVIRQHAAKIERLTFFLFCFFGFLLSSLSDHKRLAAKAKSVHKRRAAL